MFPFYDFLRRFFLFLGHCYIFDFRCRFPTVFRQFSSTLFRFSPTLYAFFVSLSSRLYLLSCRFFTFLRQSIPFFVFLSRSFSFLRHCCVFAFRSRFPLYFVNSLRLCLLSLSFFVFPVLDVSFVFQNRSFLCLRH